MPSRRPTPQQVLVRRGVALAVLAAAAVGTAVLLFSALTDSSAREQIERYARAWRSGDYAGMHAQLTDSARQRYPLQDFARRHRQALETATGQRVITGAPSQRGDSWRLPVTVSTRAFGRVRGTIDLPVEGEGEAARIAWAPHRAFPGLGPSDELARETTLPPRATILARDGTPLAQGESRTSPLGAVATAVVGTLGPPAPEQLAELRAKGYPQDIQVGISGLERIFEERLAGTPGGELRAGLRLLARATPKRAPALRTTIAPRVQTAAVNALGGRLGGVVALRPRSGEILAFAGIAFSGLQPPGSTFKIITAAGALEAGIVKMDEQFPVATSATLEGVALENANGEACGGTFVNSFAHSCNSVFGPLGAKLGAERLVDISERFGFNRPPDIPGAATSTIPPAGEIGDDLAVGSTAIGQGRVQATTLQMASAAATIALRGRRPKLTLDGTELGGAAPTTRVLTPAVGRQVERLMRAVVANGTGTLAAIPGAKVAGKTGTAELRQTQGCEPDPANPDACPPDTTEDTSAWFAAYAPAGEPRIVVSVLLVEAGAGGQTAAPAARQVMVAALQR